MWPVSTGYCHAAICPESGADRIHRLDGESIAIDPTLASPVDSGIGIYQTPVALDHSGLMFANLITFAHCGISRSMVAANSAGVLPTKSRPISSRLLRASGIAITRKLSR